jgi:hypothetical protein
VGGAGTYYRDMAIQKRAWDPGPDNVHMVLSFLVVSFVDCTNERRVGLSKVVARSLASPTSHVADREKKRSNLESALGSSVEEICFG